MAAAALNLDNKMSLKKLTLERTVKNTLKYFSTLLQFKIVQSILKCWCRISGQAKILKDQTFTSLVAFFKILGTH